MKPSVPQLFRASARCLRGHENPLVWTTSSPSRTKFSDSNRAFHGLAHHQLGDGVPNAGRSAGSRR
jgi:hypothetical protein